MTFTQHFDSFACEGDTIQCDAQGFTVTARIVRDDCSDRPDERQDGFWPSLDIGDPGFIGAGRQPRQRYDAALKQAEAVMQAWKTDEWFYCGIMLSVRVDDILIAPHAASLWGIEVNYPGSDNAYLTQVANELLTDALITGREAAQRLAMTLKPWAAT
ncbi:hypothetical protein [Henriciella sp.]|uniref:hypothetical protein n=1 Tax=Henriciella sp. TaxID=1968823 RepID=UPI002612630F|nr:hypothetical protein [Henriciella sp.]